MKMKDVLWGFLVIGLSLFVILPDTNPLFIQMTTDYPYLMGFVKTMILASMGEMLVKRIKTGSYLKDSGLWMKAIVWGLLGMTFVFVFPLFDHGVHAIFNDQTIFENAFFNALFYALMVSLTMNVIFAPTFMMLHRVTDTYIHLSSGSPRKLKDVKLNDVIDHIDFKFFFSYVIFKTIPFFWIPAHTITFMLPATYRVLMASYLSIVLGILMSIKKTSK